VLGLYAYCDDVNLAIFSIDSDYNSFYSLNLADSDNVVTGNTIYVLGSPMALMNSITDGVVSAAARVVDESTYIQFSAPISFGSGGSPLLNSLGQVIGVAYLSFAGGQNLNLAVPINRIANLEIGEITPLDEVMR
jgi:S1-C subfamily serine protease